MGGGLISWKKALRNTWMAPKAFSPSRNADNVELHTFVSLFCGNQTHLIALGNTIVLISICDSAWHYAQTAIQQEMLSVSYIYDQWVFTISKIE